MIGLIAVEIHPQHKQDHCLIIRSTIEMVMLKISTACTQHIEKHFIIDLSQAVAANENREFGTNFLMETHYHQGVRGMSQNPCYQGG